MIETFSLVTKQRTSRERNDKRRLERRPKEGEEEIRLEEIRLEEIREKTDRGRRADFGEPTKQNWNRNIRSSYAGGGVKGVRV